MGGAALVAGLDAGGTTFKCGLADASGALVARRRVPTTTPSDTIASCTTFFLDAAHELGATISVLGVASFGPIDVDDASVGYGAILNTPKAGWRGVNLAAKFAQGVGAPVVVDTDVNAALLAEMTWGAAQGARAAAYVTIGTGIGAGIFSCGGFVGRPRHPEVGHIRVQRHPADEAFKGICPVHGDCLEGLASATAVAARHGNPARLPLNHPGWDIQAWYVAQACLTLSLSIRPDRIILGGGLMLAEHLLPRVCEQYRRLMNGYLGESVADIEGLICKPGLGDDAGLMGGVALALKRPIVP